MTNRMPKWFFVAALCAGLAVALPAQAQDTDNHFTGSWVHYLSATNLETGPFLPALMTHHSDGTMTGSSSVMFGSPSLPLAVTRLSPVHAVWEKIGPKTVAVTSLWFAFEADGKIRGYQRNRAVFTLDDDPDTYRGMLFLESLACTGPYGLFSCPDPLDPAAEWTPNPGMPPEGYKVIGRRIKVVPYPE